MPGPLSGTLRKDICSEEPLNNASYSLCLDPLQVYLKTPKIASKTGFTKAKVFPGPMCIPETFSYTRDYFDSSQTYNQDGDNSCDCQNRGIRLAINKFDEDLSNAPKKIIPQPNTKASSIQLPVDGPCAYRESYFAWDLLGDTSIISQESLAIPPNQQGEVKPLTFNPNSYTNENGEPIDGVQFETSPGDCNPEFSGECGNITKLNGNELVNYCFIDQDLGFNDDETTYVSQAQVQSVADKCAQADSWPYVSGDSILDEFIATCCQEITVDSDNGVFVRRDLLHMAGCRATVHSLNNGDGKNHKPNAPISQSQYMGGPKNPSDKFPYNFDYQTDFEELPRGNSAQTGYNQVCLLDKAFDEMKMAECTTISQKSVDDVVTEKTRDENKITDDAYFSQEYSPLPFYADACIMPKYFIDGTDQNVPPEDSLRIFGMYPRQSTLPVDDIDKTKTPWLELPLYYHMVANALKGNTRFQILETTEVIELLSTMSPSEYLFAGGLSFARHWFRASYEEQFGDDFTDTEMERVQGWTYYARHCERNTEFSHFTDKDYMTPPNYCLGGKDFIDFHWCRTINEENDKNFQNFDESDPIGDNTKLFYAYILKLSQGSFDDLPDLAVVIATRCKEKYETSLVAECIRLATDEFLMRSTTCTGFPVRDGSEQGNVFKGRGNNPGIFCKGSQSYTVSKAYVETPSEMPTEYYFKKCTTNDKGKYYFDGDAPKLQGFFHPLFYKPLSSQSDGKSVPSKVSPAQPVERDFSYMEGLEKDNTVVQSLFPENIPRTELGDVYAASNAFNDLWDKEEAYVYDNSCERGQFLGSLESYPTISMASGGDYRFDASRDGCSDEVKRGNTPQYNFLASFNDQEGCVRIVDDAIKGVGLMAASRLTVSPVKFPQVQYSAVKSLLTVRKLAGDVLKGVVEGAVVGGIGIAFTPLVSAVALQSIGLDNILNPDDNSAEKAEKQRLLMIQLEESQPISNSAHPNFNDDNEKDSPLNDEDTLLTNPASDPSPVDKSNTDEYTKNSASITRDNSKKGSKIVESKKKGVFKSEKNPQTIFVMYNGERMTTEQVLTEIREAAFNYHTEFGKDQEIIDAIKAYSELYDAHFANASDATRPCNSFVDNPTKDDDTGAYVYSLKNPTTGEVFQKVLLLDKNTRGVEYARTGKNLYPDKLVFNQAHQYEFHPYISRMTEMDSYRNKVPTFMMGPFIDGKNHDDNPDNSRAQWKNVLGAFPSIKQGQTVYCSNILGDTPPNLEEPTPFRIFKDQNRAQETIYSRVAFDSLEKVQRLRHIHDKTPIFGSHSEKHGVTSQMKKYCQLCFQYGYPSDDSQPLDENEICRADNKNFVWNLKHSLHDPNFNNWIGEKSGGTTVSMNFRNTSFTSESDQEKIEGLLGMQIGSNWGKPLPYDRRVCQGDLQSFPVGVPGICEMRKEIYVPDEDEVGVSCNNATGTYGARCVHPFWHNPHRFIFPTKQSGYNPDAMVPNYCYNNFDFENDATYKRNYDANNVFTGFSPPPFKKDSKQYVYCSNDPLDHDLRDLFCKSGGYLSWSGIAIGAMTDPDLICTPKPASGTRTCLFIVDNPGLTIQELFEKASGPNYTTRILIVPIAWKALRLIWMFPSTIDHSFFNKLYVDNQIIQPYNGEDPKTKGPFLAQKLFYKPSTTVMQGICYINSQDDENQVENALARLLVTVASMKISGTTDYLFPAFDSDLVITKDVKMTVKFSQEEVFPTIVTSPIKLGTENVRNHPVIIESAFTPSVMQRAKGIVMTDDTFIFLQTVNIPTFIPENKDTCVIFEVGMPRTTLRYLNFDQSSCTAKEEYKRSPVVYSSQDASLTFVSDIMIRDGPGPLFKGMDAFDGYSRTYGWTMETTGAVVQNIILTSSSDENGRATNTYAGASRTLDTIGFFDCSGGAFKCDSVAVHTKGAVGNFTNGNVQDHYPTFACDGIARHIDSNTNIDTLITAAENRDLDDFDTLVFQKAGTSFDVNNLQSLRYLAVESNKAMKTGRYESFDYGITQTSVNESTTMFAFVAASGDDRVVRCSGTGCPGGNTKCTETCKGLQTATDYGIIQDWRLVRIEENTFKICVLRRPDLCMPKTYRIPEDGNLAEIDGPLAVKGVFILQNMATNLCLNTYNLTIEVACDPMDDGQQWQLNDNSRLEMAGNPYLCISAYAQKLDEPFMLTCFPCSVGESALKNCQNLAYVTPKVVSNTDTTDDTQTLIQTYNLIRIPISTTHSMLFFNNGDCLSTDMSYNTTYCRPECLGAIYSDNSDMCAQPLGVGRVLCNFLNRGKLASIRGDTSILERAQFTKMNVMGKTSGAKAVVASLPGMVYIDSSDNFFIDKEDLVFSNGALFLKAGVGTVYYQPIDDLSTLNAGELNVVNITEISSRFGEDFLEAYEEQFIPSPLLYQVVVAIETIVLISVIVLHVVLVYKEQKLIEELKAEN